MNLAQLAKVAMTDESAATELMIQLRWPNGAACPRCGGAEPWRVNRKGYKGHPPRRGLFKCSQCRKQFTVTTGTIFEASHLKMSTWLMAIHLMSSSKKGMSAHQLHRMLGITYKAAWFAFHRLREAMSENKELFGKLKGVVEADETYIGGYRRLNKMGAPQVPVFASVQRRGRVVAQPVEMVNGRTLAKVVEERVAHNATLMTDEATFYRSVAHDAGMKHQTVHHRSKEYVRGNAHTNTVEGFFSLLKRGINGTFHHVSKGHLHRYCDEFAFRYNNRIALGVDDSQRAAKIVLNAEGKRLTYRSRTGASAA